MANRNLTDEDIEALSKSLGKVINRQAPTSSGSATLDIPGTNKSLNLFDEALKGAGKGVDLVKDAYRKVEGEITSSMNTWRDLSKSGLNFSNDIIGMSVAAKGTRMSLDEFAGMVKENKVFLAGFGGTIGKGAEEFGKTSKVMFDQYGETTDRLRQMGYTNKDLNEVLALQSGLIGNSMRQGKERDRIAIESASALATEMDLLAKMTGKSREEQMANAKKLQADAAFNAKLEQTTRGMSEKEAAEYKTKMMAEYAKAEAIGMGQAFKETYVFGSVMTKQAATEQAIAGKAGAETIKSAMAASAGNFEEASKRSAAAQDAAVANNKNAAFQNMVIYGQFTGAVGEAAQKQFMTNKAMTDSVEAIKKEEEARRGTKITDQEAKKILQERLEKEQKGAAGTTAAAVNLEARFKDAQSAIANSLVGPLNKDVDPALRKLSESALGARGALVDLVTKKQAGDTRTFPQAFEQEVEKGRKASEEGKQVPGNLLGGAGYASREAAQAANKGGLALDKELRREPEKRSGGTLGMTGNLYEKMGTLIEITKPDESVMTESQMKNFARGMLDKGAEKALTGLRQIGSQPLGTGIDLGKISQDIGTTVSSTKVEMPKISKETAKVEVINWPKEFGTIKQIDTPEKASEKSKEPLKTAETKTAEIKPVTQASIRAIDNELDMAKPSWQSAAGEFGEEQKLPFASMIDEFGSNFDKVIADLNTGLGVINVEKFGIDLEQINKDLIDSLPVVEVAKTQDEFKSEFTESQRKLIDDYKGLSEENRKFTIQALEYHNNQDLSIRDKHNRLISELEQARNERELTAEEEHQLSESKLIEDAANERLQKRSEELDVLKNLDELSAKRQVEIAEISNAAVVKANEAAMLEINDIQSDIESTLSAIDFKPTDIISEEDTDYISAAIKDALPFDEMGGVDEAAKQQEDLGMIADDMRAGLDEIAGDIQTNLGSMLDEYNQDEAEEDDTDYISTAIKDALPFDEMGGVDKAVDKQMNQELFPDDMRSGLDEIAGDIQSNLGSMLDEYNQNEEPEDDTDYISAAISDAMPFDEMKGLDQAVAKNQADDEAKSEFARETRKSSSLSDSMKDAVKTTNPTASSDKFNLDSLSFSPTGMPIVRQVKQATAQLPDRKDSSQDDTETAKFKRQSEAKNEDKKSSETRESKASSAGGGKDGATLNDVLGALNKLNNQMGTLISLSEDMGKKQIQATKSNNGNIFART